MTYPLAVLVPLFGTGLIYSAHFDLWKSEWLLIAIPIHVAIFSLTVRPDSERQQDDQAAAGNARTWSRGRGPASGPPPELEALGKKLQFGGIAMGSDS